MTSEAEDEASKKASQNGYPPRVLLAPSEYPGTLPSAAELERAAQLRQDGNLRYAEGSFDAALCSYSAAAALSPSDHLVYSNRSQCLLRMGRVIEALDDAELCIALAPGFARGFLRKGNAEQMLNRRVDAQASFARGLSHDADNEELKRAVEALRADNSGTLQTTLYHVLFVSPHLHMDRLFQVLEDPDRLTASYVQEQAAQLDAQFACLTQTLRVDLGLLFGSPVLRDAYDRVTFACGQLLQWAPEAVTKHLQQAQRIVQGLGLAMRCGWSIHHGVAKFSANALVVLATCEGAEDNLRREALRLLLGGLRRWLLDPLAEPESPPEDRSDRDVCGCSFLSPRLSAATWLERLFEHGTRRWVREECERFPGILQLVVHLCLVVRDERGVPLGLPCLLRLPAVARQAMECEAILDLTTSNREAFSRREGRRGLRQRGKPGGGASGSTAETASPASPAGSPPRPPAAPEGGPGPLVLPPATAAGGTGEAGSGSVAAAAATGQAGQAAAAPRAAAPAQRLGEWLMASLGYLLVFVDDDALFAAHSCSALSRLANATPDGVARLTEGVWMGLPVLERLSSLACQHTAALELLETLARHSAPARAAMLSLAAALVAAPPTAGLDDSGAPMVPADPSAEPVAEPPAEPLVASDGGGPGEDGGEVVAMDVDVDGGSAEAEAAVDSVGEAVTEPARVPQETPPRDPEHEHDALGEPSWVEFYHELHDELWVQGEAPAEVGRPPRFHGVVSLGNFLEAAPQVHVAGRLTVTRLSGWDDAMQVDFLSSGEGMGGGSSSSSSGRGSSTWEAAAIPSVWNPRADDAVAAPLSVDDRHRDIGTPAWSEGKQGSVVLLLRSSIQRSPATPDWATSAWLCAEAGARAALVVNDMPDDGPVQPAFRMGLFGSLPPPIPAFMICGRDGAKLRELARQAGPGGLRVALRSVPVQGAAEGLLGGPRGGDLGGTGAGDVPPPVWPLVLRIFQDVAQAWSLVEMVHRAVPSPALAGALDALARRMGLPEKRIWLTRRLQRFHRGDTDADEPVEPPLAFVECDREGDQLRQLRRQLAERTGIAAPDITGEFEVRFREESSVGSAVVREWMDLLARKAFLPQQHRLLISYDGGVTFLPDPAAPFLNPQWRGDFELLGRLVGLALWHQVTLDLPLHPHVCELLLGDPEELPPPSEPMKRLAADRASLEAIDAELCRHKVQWVLENDVSALGFGLPFTDVLLEANTPPPGPLAAPAAAAAGAEGAGATGSPGVAPGAADEAQREAEAAAAALGALPPVVSPGDTLPGDRRAGEPLRLRPSTAGGAQVALVPGGEDLEVSQENKGLYVEKLLDWRLRGALRGPVAAMVQGLHAAVPAAVVEEARRMLTAAEVHGLLAGLREVDVNDWQQNTRMAGGLTPATREVRWFWQIVRQWSADGRQERLQDLLQFATGSRRVPVGGFAQLVGFNGGKHLFTLARGAHLSAQSLPTSHACICTVDLPPWESFEAARQKLTAALDAGRGRFDEGLAAVARNGGD